MLIMKTVVCVVGGLGNQMFHAAYALALRTKGGNADLNDFLAAHGQSHYGSELMDVFHVKISKARYLVPFIWGIRKCIVFKEIYPSFVRFIFGMLWFLRIGIVTDYLKDRLSCPNQWLTICYGRFQSESHFKPVEKEVREMFRFDPSLISAANKKLAAEMELGESAFIHIRRGDYLSDKYKAIFGGICTVEYYTLAIQYLSRETSVNRFYVFSDDIAWVREHLEIPNPLYVDWNTGVDSWQDLYLMTCCKHGIVANSTFSWWGAWLIDNPSKVVVCPSKYTNTNDDAEDFYPLSWKRM